LAQQFHGIRKDFRPTGDQAAYTVRALNVVGRHMEAAALNADWEMLVEEIAAQQEPLASPVTQFLLAHALLSLNRNNESFLLFWSGNSETQRKAWLEWTSRLIERNPHNAVAHYLRGDALARLGEWPLAIEDFNNALRLGSNFYLALHARGIARVGAKELDAAMKDLTAVAEDVAPDFVEGHISLGTFWIQVRGKNGAVKAFEQAIVRAPTSLLARNGRAYVLFACGKWEKAAEELREAANDSSATMLPFVLRNLREVAVAQDAIGKESDELPEFWPSDFLDWAALHKASLRDNDILKDLFDDSELPERPDEVTIKLLVARLNAALDDPGFYQRYQDRFDLDQARPELRKKIQDTQSARQKEAPELTKEEKKQIRQLNRMLIELAYSPSIERHDSRHSGTLLASQNGLSAPQGILNRSVSTGVSQQGQMIGFQAFNPWLIPAVRAVATLSPGLGPIAQTLPTMGAVRTALSSTWNNHRALLGAKYYAEAVTIGSTLFATRAPNPYVQVGAALIGATSALTARVIDHRIGGVSADTRRAYVDEGNWNMEAPFGLVYYDTEAG
jgi:tetratricopeptide (TPR) repeat protein